MTTPAEAAAAARGVLVAIVESTDSAVTANERLRAIELLREMGGDDQGALALAAWVSGLDTDELAPTFASLVGGVPAVVEAEREAEVQRRVDELRAGEEQRLQERARQIAEAMYAERDQLNQQDQRDQRDLAERDQRDFPERDLRSPDLPITPLDGPPCGACAARAP